MAVLTTKQRKALPTKAFALPDDRYPIHDLNHAHAALSMVAAHGTPDEQATVKAAVHRKYPAIEIADFRARVKGGLMTPGRTKP